MSNFPKVLCSVAPIARVLSMALSGSSGCQLFFNTARNFSKYHSGAALVKAAQVPVEFDMQTLNMKLRRALDLHANVVHDYAIRNNRKRVTAVHMSLRFYSNSGPGSDPKEETTEESQEAHKAVFDYVESEKFHRENNDLKNITLPEACALIGTLRTQLNYERGLNTELRMLLGFRSEIEELEIFLWPTTISKPTNRTVTWTEILTSTKPEFTSNDIIMEFRVRLANECISVDFFIKKGVCKFYEKSSTLVCHKIKFPERSTVTETVIENVLFEMGLPQHNLYKKSIKMLLQPIASLN